MKRKYVSIDIEASGPSPGKYSMLSIGACIVGESHKRFYRELKPLNYNYMTEAMKIGCLGLLCLKSLEHNAEYNPQSAEFNPRKALKRLFEAGQAPEEAMAEFAGWINDNTKGYEPIETEAPVKFDGMFVTWYFDNFYSEKNPLSYKALDIGSLYSGYARNEYAKIEDLKISDERTCPHNALEDAIQQAKELEAVLRLIRK